jgi:hypothetical protein
VLEEGTLARRNEVLPEATHHCEGGGQTLQ